MFLQLLLSFMLDTNQEARSLSLMWTVAWPTAQPCCWLCRRTGNYCIHCQLLDHRIIDFESFPAGVALAADACAILLHMKSGQCVLSGNFFVDWVLHAGVECCIIMHHTSNRWLCCAGSSAPSVISLQEITAAATTGRLPTTDSCQQHLHLMECIGCSYTCETLTAVHRSP